jgi:hypothetical protein
MEITGHGHSVSAVIAFSTKDGYGPGLGILTTNDLDRPPGGIFHENQTRQAEFLNGLVIQFFHLSGGS